ncbi:CPBP family intramembrane glutamic endopeptidase [Chloroflexus sp.]|uniref:CPBP family intramembrane glutamic endopeptidase n=1 Tax=Chloroflexus sp. TaxID=1904827 RepID=UPI002ADDD942|nr:CPBP family intramembrane glutamic endopeptidase [Chloroflexus sp.]
MRVPVSVQPTRSLLDDPRIRWGGGLVAAVWLIGLVGGLTGLSEWPALVLYVIGGLGVAFTLGRTLGWAAIGVTKTNLRSATIWGAGIGLGLMILDWVNTFFYYRGGGEPMAAMEAILVGMGLLYLFPVLVLAEELLWRGVLLIALREAGWNAHLTVGLTTLLYALNHLFVAPVPLFERWLMVGMALPIGVIGGYLVLRTRNVWAAVWVHGLSIVAMIADIFIIPGLARG